MFNLVIELHLAKKANVNRVDMEAVLQQKLSIPDTLGQIKVSKDPIYRSVLISENLNRDVPLYTEVSEMSGSFSM